MAFADQPTPSLLRLWPLPQIGLFVARLVHGGQTNPAGDIVTARRIIPAEIAWRLGQSYAGLVGVFALPVLFAYLHRFHADTGTRRTYTNVFGMPSFEHRLGHWSDLPLDLKIVLPLAIVFHIIGIVSAIRWVLIRRELDEAG